MTYSIPDKTCTICTCVHPATRKYFGKDKSRKDQLSIYCIECKRKKAKVRDNSPRYTEIRLQKRITARLFVLEYYKSHPCSCGESRSECLQANHIDPSQKSYHISTMVGRGYPVSAIQLELDKCEILCANCHAVKTAKQFNWYRNVNTDNNRI